MQEIIIFPGLLFSLKHYEMNLNRYLKSEYEDISHGRMRDIQVPYITSSYHFLPTHRKEKRKIKISA